MYQLGFQPSNILSVYNSLSFEEYPIFGPVVIYASTAIIFLFYPLSGFLADNRFGRYKTIIRSLQVLFVSFILGWLCLVIFWNLTIASDKMSLIGFYGLVSVAILLFFPVILGLMLLSFNLAWTSSLTHLLITKDYSFIGMCGYTISHYFSLKYHG